MKKNTFVLLATLLFSLTSFAQQAIYDVTPGDGNGIRFWQSDLYKIHGGHTSDYLFGPVTNFSIKNNMDTNPGRGWTWGIAGSVPVMALSNIGQMEIAGSFTSRSTIVSRAASAGYLALSGDLPGSAAGIYPTLKTEASYMYFSSAGKYSAFLGDTQTRFGLNDAGGATKVVIHTNGSTYFSGGNVGIGTSNPLAKLHVVGGEINLDADQALRGGGRWLISGNANQVTVGTANPGINLRFDAGEASRMFINGSTGNVGVGTASPDQRLSVKGKIHAEEVIIDLSVPAPDYVFEQNYSLTSLDEVQAYIAKHKHLPEVPSAKEMEKDGVKVGEMEMVLLKKIEELTLYAIELKSENESIKEQNIQLNATLNERLNTLEAELKLLMKSKN
jgi:hypothetical protein